MKVLHLCLANFFIDKFSYQENLLAKTHKQMGLDVEIIASLISFNKEGEICDIQKEGTYFNEHGIKVTRIRYKEQFLSRRLRKYKNLYNLLVNSKPDIIFIHGCQFMDIKYVAKYAKMNPAVKIYVDNHADFSNSARNWISKNILHKIIWKHCAHLINPYTKKFYGVLPARVDFLKNVYGLPEEKIELLLMGADDELVSEAKDKKITFLLREKYKISQNDFLIVTGGKIDNAKRQILLLMEAVKNIQDNKLKLIIFGSVLPEIKEAFLNLVDNQKVQYIGWIRAEESYKLFSAADLVVFPGRHSVYWEQVIAIRKPLIVKYWPGTTHIDIGGNCRFLYEDSMEEIKENIELLLNNTEEYQKMKKAANKPEADEFLYSKIAKKSIEV